MFLKFTFEIFSFVAFFFFFFFAQIHEIKRVLD